MFYEEFDKGLRHGITFKFLKETYQQLGLLTTPIALKEFY